MPSRSGSSARGASPPRGALAGTRGAALSLAVRYRERPPRQGPAGRCPTRQLCRVVGVYQKCPLPKTHPRGADAALNSRLHSRPIFSIATRSWSDGEQDFCKTGRQTRSWVVCWVHSLEGPRGEPKGFRSPPSNPPPHRVPREFRKSRVGGGGGWGMRWADSRPTHVQGPIQKTVSK